MSIEAVISRIGVIAQAQQRLVSPTGSSASPPVVSIGGLLAGAQAAGAQAAGTSPSTSFASALAAAQSGTTGLAAGSGTTAPGELPTGLTVGTGAAAGSGLAASGAVDPGAVVAQASWNPEGKPIAGWIVPVLAWASQHGWTGTVTSGYRSYSQQAAINASGAFSAPAGKSNHEATQYPGGAVDVTDPAQLLQVLKGYTGPYKLVGGVLGAADPEHFSATGR